MPGARKIDRGEFGRWLGSPRLAAFGVLIFVLSIFSHLFQYSSRPASEGGVHCAQAAAQSASGAGLSSEAPLRHDFKHFGHCADCPMTAQLIEPPRAELGVGERVTARLVFNPPRAMDRRDRRRSGEAQSRAPPKFS